MATTLLASLLDQNDMTILSYSSLALLHFFFTCSSPPLPPFVCVRLLPDTAVVCCGSSFSFLRFASKPLPLSVSLPSVSPTSVALVLMGGLVSIHGTFFLTWYDVSKNSYLMWCKIVLIPIYSPIQTAWLPSWVSIEMTDCMISVVVVENLISNNIVDQNLLVIKNQDSKNTELLFMRRYIQQIMFQSHLQLSTILLLVTYVSF